MSKYFIQLLNVKFKRNIFAVLGIFFVCNVISACDDSKKISTYKAESSNAVDVEQKTTEKTHTLIWDIPQGWKEEKLAYTMQTAVFSVADDGDKNQSLEPAVASITILSGTAGGVFQNVNRWRQQVGLNPIQDEKTVLASAKKIKGKLKRIKWYSIIENNSDQGVFAAIIPDKDNTIFVKLIGPVKILKSNESKFITFVSSINHSK